MAVRNKLTRDILFFIKNDLNSNITDPISNRAGNSAFVMTSFPEREVVYPVIVITLTNQEETRAGMQTTAMDIDMFIEVRVWSKSVTQSDKLMQDIAERLRVIQFSSSGSVDNDFHDFSIISNLRVDEPGKGGVKSRIIQVNYRFFNV